jgi:hypothetical protein
MRIIVFGVLTACILLHPPHAAAAPTSSDDAALLKIEAVGDSAPERWQGRHHYLYDDENQPNSATVGSAPSDARACAREPVRLRRSDGSTVVRRIRRCD